jgi:hypothetical protein
MWPGDAAHDHDPAAGALQRFERLVEGSQHAKEVGLELAPVV